MSELKIIVPVELNPDIRKLVTDVESVRPVVDVDVNVNTNNIAKDIQNNVNRDDGVEIKINTDDVRKNIQFALREARRVQTELNRLQLPRGSINSDRRGLLGTRFSEQIRALEDMLNSRGKNAFEGYQRGINELRRTTREASSLMRDAHGGFENFNASKFHLDLKGISREAVNIRNNLSTLGNGLGYDELRAQERAFREELGRTFEMYHNLRRQQRENGSVFSDDYHEFLEMVDRLKRTRTDLSSSLGFANNNQINKLNSGIRAYARDYAEALQLINNANLKGESSKENLNRAMQAQIEAQRAYNAALAPVKQAQNTGTEAEANAVLRCTEAKKRLTAANKELVAAMRAVRQAQDSQRKSVGDMTNAEYFYAASIVEQKKNRMEWMRQSYSKAFTDIEWAADFKRINNSLYSEDAVLRVKELSKEIAGLETRAKAAGLAGKTLGQRFKEGFNKFSSWFSISTIFMKMIQLMGKMINNVKAIDSAMTDLRKVTEASETGYNSYLDSAMKRSSDMSSKVSEYIAGTTGWARLGYDLDDAQQLGELSTIYFNVGDGVESVDDATSSLISTMKAYKIEADGAASILDRLNYVGNNFNITSGGMGEALQRSAASLATANTDLNKSMALITAGNTIINNPEKVGNGLKTVSARIRGATSELQEAGEEVDEYVTSTSKLQGKIMSLTGVDIMKNATEFKDIYDILKEISEAYDSLTDTSRAELTEVLFGKIQANLGSAILSNFDIAEEVYDELESGKAGGSAEKEYEKWQDSLEARQKKLSSTFERTSVAFFDEDLLKAGYDILTNILNVINAIVETAGSLPSVFGAAIGVLSLLNPSSSILPIQQIKDANGDTQYKFISKAGKYRQEVYNQKIDKEVGILNAYRDAAGDSKRRAALKGQLSLSTIEQIDFKEMDAGVESANVQITKFQENSKAAIKTNAGFMASMAGVAKSFAVMSLQMAAAFVAMKAVELVFRVIDNVINASEHAIEKADKLKDAWSQMAKEETAAKKLVDDYGKRYEELRQGIGQQGENISLTTSEYEEYISISNKLAETFPELISGWDAQGNAILKATTRMEDFIEANKKMVRDNREEQSFQFSESGYAGEVARLYSSDKGSYTAYEDILLGQEKFEEWLDTFSKDYNAPDLARNLGWYAEDAGVSQDLINNLNNAIDDISHIEFAEKEPDKSEEYEKEYYKGIYEAVQVLYGEYQRKAQNQLAQANYDLVGMQDEYRRMILNAFDSEANPLYGGGLLSNWKTVDQMENFLLQIPYGLGHDVFKNMADVNKDGKYNPAEFREFWEKQFIEKLRVQETQNVMSSLLSMQDDFLNNKLAFQDLFKHINELGDESLFGTPNEEGINEAGKAIWSVIVSKLIGDWQNAYNRASSLGLDETALAQLTAKDLEFISRMPVDGEKLSGIDELRRLQKQTSESIDVLVDSYNKFMSDQEKALTNLNALSEQGYLTPEQMKEIDQTGYSRAVVTTPYGTQHTDYQITRQIELAKAQEEINRLTEEGNKKQAEAKEAYEEFLKLAKEGKKEQAEAQKVALDGYVNEINQINLMADAIRGSTSALNAFKRACQMGELGDGFRSAKEAIDAIIEGLENGKVGTNKFRAAIELIGGSDMLSKFQNGLISNQTLKDFAENAGKFYNDEGDIDRRKVFDMMAESGVGSYYMQDGKQRFRVNRDATMEEYQEAFGGVSVEFASLILDAINENAKNDSEIIGPEDYRRRRKENEEALQKVKNMSVSANSVVINGNVEGGSDGSDGNGSNGNGSNGNGEVPNGKKTEPPAQEPPPQPEPEIIITNAERELIEAFAKAHGLESMKAAANAHAPLANAHAPFPDIDDLSRKFEALTPSLNASLDSIAAFLQVQRTAQAQRNELQNIYEEAGYSDSVDAEYLNALLDLMNQYDDSIFKTHDKLSERKNIPSGSKAEEESTAEGVEPEKEATVTEAAEEAAVKTTETFSQAYARFMNYVQTGFASGDIPTPHNQGASNQPPQNDESAESPDTSTETVSSEIERLNKNLEGFYTSYNDAVQGYNDGNGYLSKKSTLDILQFLAKQVSANLDSYKELPNVGPEDQNIISYENLLNDINSLINALSGAGSADLPFGGWMIAYNMPYTDVRGRGRGGAKDVPGTSGEADTESLSDETVEVEVVANTEKAEEQISALSESSEEPVEIPVTTELEEASSKNAELVEAVKEKTTKPVDADTAEADAAVNSLNAEIERTATKSTDASQIRAAIRYANELNALLAKEIVKPFSMGDGGGGNSGGGSGVDGGVAKVDGGMSLAGGNTLVGEIAPEIIVDRKTGTWRLVDYPQLTHLNPGDIVFNGKQTEAILKGRKTHFSKAMVDGNAKGGKSFAGYIGKARKPDSIYTSIDRKIVQQREGFVVFDDPDGNGVVIPQTWDISQDVGDGKGKKNGKGGGGGRGGGSGEKEEREWIDWIERLLELAKKATEKAVEDVADKIGYIAKNAQLDLALTKNRAELQKNEAAYNRYIEQADLMRKRNGLSADIVNKIQTGAIDITEYGQEMANKIKEYQEWYEKAEKCKDTIDELNKQEKELQRQKLDNIVDVFENKIARLESSISLNSTKLEKKAAYGEEIVAQDYIDAIAATEKKIAQLQEERTAYAKQFNALVKSGVLEPNSDAWHEYISNLEEIDETIVQTHTDLAGLKDEMSNIPLTNLQYALERLKALQSDIEAFRSFHDAQGTKNEPGSLIELIENGHEQIQNLKDQNEMLKSQQGGLDVLSEKWQELQGQIESNEQAIWDIKSAQEEWNDAITDLQIDRLQEEREELEKTNEELEKRKEMEDAIEEYEKAKQRTKLVYQAGKGFQYVADQDAIKEAKDRLDELRHQEMLDKIDEAIEALEDQKETDNIYDYQGIDVLKAFTGNEGSELYDLVHATTDFDKLLSDKMATVLGSNNARGTEALSVQIGDITVQGVQNVDDFAQSIVDELPNRLIQKLYS